MSKLIRNTATIATREVAFVGDIVRLPSGPAKDPNRPHATIVIGISSKDLLLASICTLKEGDDGCVLLPVHVPEVDLHHESFVMFEKAFTAGHGSFSSYEYLCATPPETLARVLTDARKLLPEGIMTGFYKLPPSRTISPSSDRPIPVVTRWPKRRVRAPA